MCVFHLSLIVYLLQFILSSVDISKELYLDPGSGSFILQIIIASLLGAAYLIKTYWKRIKIFFRGNPPRIDEEEGIR